MNREILGEHNGIINFTVGQRKGLGIAHGEPLYVVKINAKDNEVVVGPINMLMQKKIFIKELNWLEQPQEGQEVTVKLRSSHTGSLATIYSTEEKNKACVILSNDYFGISPGQACVAYKGEQKEIMLAIDNCEKTDLHFAAEEARIEDVEYLVKNGADLHAKDENGRTPLHYAVKESHTEIILFLIEKGVDVHAKDKNGYTPLHWAARKGYAEVVETLIAKGANVNAADNNGETALYLATEGGFINIAKILIEKGANVNTANHKGETVLCVAAECGFVKIVKALLKKEDINVNVQDENGRTALYWAAVYGRGEVVNRLLNTEGIEVNTADNNGETALYWAAAGGHLKIVKALLKKEGINVNAAGGNRETALHRAAAGGHLEIVKALLAAGADINLVNENGMNPLSKAIAHKKTDVYEHMIEHITELKNSGLQLSSYNLGFVEKMAFLHNHKPLIDVLSQYYGSDFQTMTLEEIENFFKKDTNDIVLKIGREEKYPIDLVDFGDVNERHEPKLKLHALGKIINQILKPNSQVDTVGEGIIQIRVGERVANF
ncbi:Adenine nucleotide alpha hydrolase-like domains,Ankyrin repeat-containing domain,Ankyrin repeat [Cinara cedri]|uniref:Adenine nucleotide alpha hydrolase-like domains,Ankyrin repeat-containing domain,Ankyrin repeat n=1 Tax=Cinara cedri TaxID=506608 RepID=A0A5E4M9D1_9HEMI|nr:Adenine nucleotide alpha hydrolase-like domains,Ankyrin repeat-containing domain,Ankyrin repeat [Cinara cedri]